MTAARRKKRVVTIYKRGDTLILEFPNAAYIVRNLEGVTILQAMQKILEDQKL